MKDNKNIVVPFLSEINVPEWAVSEIFGESDPELTCEDRGALSSFQSRWVVMDYGDEPRFCTPDLFYRGQNVLSGTCLACKCLPKILANAKLYHGDLAQRMGKTRIVCIYNGLQIGGGAFKPQDFRSTLLETIKLYNAVVSAHPNGEGFLIFKRGELIFASNKKFESLIPQIREKFPHIFNL